MSINNKATVKKNIILNEIDIQPLINMEIILNKFFKNVQEDEDFTEIEEMGLVKGFEISYELTWKTLKKVLEIQGVEALNPREVFRLSAQFGYIEDSQVWFDFGKERNLTTHVYDENIFHNLINFISKFLNEFRKVIGKLEGLK
ncbi:MAG: hypothetical protein AM1032_000151 [Mycoplasmataceae bacterium]|nr:MAG: hypothetical protein AM1032_000151 [Mycoplasmataceae bacterium]